MAQKKPAENALAEMVREAQGMFALNPLAGPQVRQFWEAQESLLSETEEFSRHWFERRHAAARSAIEAARQVADTGASDPAVAMKALTDWQSASMERMAEDLREWLDLCTRCADLVARRELEAGQEAIEETTKRAAGAAGSKHSTPV